MPCYDTLYDSLVKQQGRVAHRCSGWRTALEIVGSPKQPSVVSSELMMIKNHDGHVHTIEQYNIIYI